MDYDAALTVLDRQIDGLRAQRRALAQERRAQLRGELAPVRKRLASSALDELRVWSQTDAAVELAQTCQQWQAVRRGHRVVYSAPVELASGFQARWLLETHSVYDPETAWQLRAIIVGPDSVVCHRSEAVPASVATSGSDWISHEFTPDSILAAMRSTLAA